MTTLLDVAAAVFSAPEEDRVRRGERWERVIDQGVSGLGVVCCFWCRAEASSAWVAKVNRWARMFPDDPDRDHMLCPDCSPAHGSMMRLMVMLVNAYGLKHGWIPPFHMTNYGNPDHVVTLRTAIQEHERHHYSPDAESHRVHRAFADMTTLEPENIAIVRDGRRFKFVQQTPATPSTTGAR